MEVQATAVALASTRTALDDIFGFGCGYSSFKMSLAFSSPMTPSATKAALRVPEGLPLRLPLVSDLNLPACLV